MDSEKHPLRKIPVQKEQRRIPAPEVHLDHDILASLRELDCDDDPEFSQRLIRSFLRDAAERLPDMRESVAMGQVEQVTRDAHRLKGTCGNMGARYMGELFGQLEVASASADQETAAVLLSQIEKELRFVEMALAVQR